MDRERLRDCRSGRARSSCTRTGRTNGELALDSLNNAAPRVAAWVGACIGTGVLGAALQQYPPELADPIAAWPQTFSTLTIIGHPWPQCVVDGVVWRHCIAANPGRLPRARSNATATNLAKDFIRLKCSLFRRSGFVCAQCHQQERLPAALWALLERSRGWARRPFCCTGMSGYVPLSSLPLKTRNLVHTFT